jgi:hypothetical protein
MARIGRAGITSGFVLADKAENVELLLVRRRFNDYTQSAGQKIQRGSIIEGAPI